MIRESFFEQKKKKPGLKFNPGFYANRLSNNWAQYSDQSSINSPLWKREGTGAEMRPAVVSGILTADAQVSYWPISFLTLETDPEVFAKVNSVQLPSGF